MIKQLQENEQGARIAYAEDGEQEITRRRRPAKNPRGVRGASPRNRRRSWVFGRRVVPLATWVEAEPSVPPSDAIDEDIGDAEPEEELLPVLQEAIFAELETSRRLTSSIAVTWSRPLRFDQGGARQALPEGGGIYIVLADDVPIYVGKAKRFVERWGGRLLSAHQIGLIPRAGASLPTLTVYFGAVDAVHRTDDKLAVVEHAAIRAIINGGLARAGTGGGQGPRVLRNAKSILPFRAKGKVEIRSVLPPLLRDRSAAHPGFGRDALQLRDMDVYELFAG